MNDYNTESEILTNRFMLALLISFILALIPANFIFDYRSDEFVITVALLFLLGSFINIYFSSQEQKRLMVKYNIEETEFDCNDYIFYD